MYFYHLLALVCVYTILSLGFSIILGLGGLFHFGYIVSVAIGAYVTALLSLHTELPWWSVVMLSGFSGTFLVLVSLPLSLRLKDDYFSIASLGIAVMGSAVLMNWRSVTGGVSGIPGIPRPIAFGRSLEDVDDFAVFSLAVASGVVVLTWLLTATSWGRTLRALKSRELVGAALGISAGRNRTSVLWYGSFLAGVGGALLAWLLRFIDPSSFALTEMVFLVAVVVLGGGGRVWRVTLSASVLTILPEILRTIGGPSHVIGPLRQIAYSGLVLGIVMWPVMRRRSRTLRKV